MQYSLQVDLGQHYSLWVSFFACYPIPTQLHVLTPLENKPFENTVGKGEIAHNEQISPFPSVFSTHLDNFLAFSSNLKLLSANTFSLKESKIPRLVMG